MNKKPRQRSASPGRPDPDPVVRVSRTLVVGEPAPRVSGLVRSVQRAEPMPPDPRTPGASRRGDPPSGVQPLSGDQAVHDRAGIDSLAPLTREDERWFEVFESLAALPALSGGRAAIDFVVRILAAQIPCEAVAGARYDAPSDRMRYVAAHGDRAAGFRGVAVSPTSGLMARAVAAEAEVCVVHDVGRARGFVASVDGCPGLETRNLVLRPLRAGGKLLGVLHLVNRVGPLSFSDAEVGLVDYVGDRLTARLRDADMARRCG